MIGTLAVAGDDDASGPVDRLEKPEEGPTHIRVGEFQGCMAVRPAQEEGAQVGLAVPGGGDPTHRPEQAGLVAHGPGIRHFRNGRVIPRRIPPDIQSPEGGRMNEESLDGIQCPSRTGGNRAHLRRPGRQWGMIGMGSPGLRAVIVRLGWGRELGKRSGVLRLVAVVVAEDHDAMSSRAQKRGPVLGEGGQ